MPVKQCFHHEERRRDPRNPQFFLLFYRNLTQDTVNYHLPKPTNKALIKPLFEVTKRIDGTRHMQLAGCNSLQLYDAKMILSLRAYNNSNIL